MSEMEEHNELEHVKHISDLYKDWFIDYASYVILERAVPHIDDGLKPVQRRILHSMWEMDDGRYNKVANIIGNTMKYHPHGDASITDALVGLGQKDLLIDTQGNWGNILTGDSAAAARYIEARLTPFAQEVVFNPKTTEWQLSYDGRNKEPITLPVKFPLLLAMGVEGIAVGLSCKILPHNFNELIDASIAALRNKKVEIYPDFPTGGIIDVSGYNDGKRGGRIKVRAKIKEINSKTIAITEIPFGTTTTALIDSIIAANEKGKLKIKKIEDNTSENVEIILHLHPDVSPDITIEALYAYTQCEMTISTNAVVIQNDKPRFMSVSEMLKYSAQRTLELLKKELEIELHELKEKWHFASLEKIFIKEEMYIDFKKFDEKEKLFEYLYKRFDKYKKQLVRPINDDDLQKLTQIPMIRITKFDSAKAEENILQLNEKIKQTQHHLDNITEYTIEYFKELKKKYGKGKERKTEIRTLHQIQKTEINIPNQKLYIDREEGFVGTSLRKNELLCECSDNDEIIAITEEGIMKVFKVSDKVYVGKNILYAGVFKRNDDKTIYNMIYRDGPKGVYFVKRFNIGGVTRDKEYNLTKGTPNSKVIYLTANPNGETEKIIVLLKPNSGARKLEIDFDFASIDVKSRSAIGNILTKYPVAKVILKEKSAGQIKAENWWYDPATKKLNQNETGNYIGAFYPDDKVLVISKNGYYKLISPDVLAFFDDDTFYVDKFNPDNIYTLIYFDGESKQYYIKRFKAENTSSKIMIINEHPDSYIELITTQAQPKIKLSFQKEKGKEIPEEYINIDELAPIINIKAKGKRVSSHKIKNITLEEPDEIKDAKKFLKSQSDTDIELTPEELHRKALEKLNSKNLPGGMGQINFDI
ncbi:MAG: DNA gyrase/topoisomerase IV subunit A [Bacteroidia bacterium]